MIKKSLVLVAVATSVWACGPKAESENSDSTTDSTQTEEAVEEGAEANMEADSVHFGEMIDAVGAKTMADLSTGMEGKDSLNIKIAAVAKDVCKKKGCWMKVETASGDMMRVTFKDYGFFVPMDITGKEVVMEGTAYLDTTSVEDLRHYAQDGGATEEEIAAITEPEIATTFVATGVMIK
tara:strand:- start:119 stop:658 length:540 start_codon:yes stop_codon:yes gene_type:complete